MATLPIVEGLTPLEEYLSRCYEPDCEFENGLIVERNVGEFEHSFLQAVLATAFTNSMDAWGVYALTEQRIRISPHSYRIPDVCVLRLGSPREPILSQPPLIAIEILSAGDSMSRLLRKCREYLEFGIEHVWIIDPADRVAWRVTPAGLETLPDAILAVQNSPIHIALPELFARMDRL